MKSAIVNQTTPEVIGQPYFTNIFKRIIPLAMLLSACSDGSNGDQTYPPYSPEVICGSGTSDTNCNGQLDVLDRVDQLMAQYGDNDGDGIVNSLDPEPNRWTVSQLIDSDGDGTPNYLDRYNGNDFGDDDGDRISNTDDPEPLNPNNQTVYATSQYTPQELSTMQSLQTMSGYDARIAEMDAQISFLQVTNEIDAIWNKDSDGDNITDIDDRYDYDSFDYDYYEEKREYEKYYEEKREYEKYYEEKREYEKYYEEKREYEERVYGD